MVSIQKLNLSTFAKVLTLFIVQLTEPAIHNALEFYFALEEGRSKDRMVLFKNVRDLLAKSKNLTFVKLAQLLQDCMECSIVIRDQNSGKDLAHINYPGNNFEFTVTISGEDELIPHFLFNIPNVNSASESESDSDSDSDKTDLIKKNAGHQENSVSKQRQMNERTQPGIFGNETDMTGLETEKTTETKKDVNSQKIVVSEISSNQKSHFLKRHKSAESDFSDSEDEPPKKKQKRKLDNPTRTKSSKSLSENGIDALIHNQLILL